MSKRVAVSSLNASTKDILNVIRANASPQYQSTIPVVETANDIPVVGQYFEGYPALANEALEALVGRISFVAMKSATFNNVFAPMKKGFLEYGETIEEIFVDLIRVFEFDAETAETELFKRVAPDVRAAFHVMNYKKFYKVTIERQKLARAVLSASGMGELITYSMNAIYVSASYDEFLTMKYLLARNILNGRLYPVSVPAVSEANMKSIVTKIKGTSNLIEFPSRKYNPAGVFQHTDKSNQYIIIDTEFDASMDVNVLASAFNMDKADFMGRRVPIDGFGNLDNDRLAELFADDPSYVEITDEEREALNAIPLALVDEKFFMIYDNLNEFREVEN